MRHTEVNKMTHIPWKCEQHLNDANPLVAATWSKPLNNFNRVRNLPASGSRNCHDFEFSKI
jgi:hypothetical protein